MPEGLAVILYNAALGKNGDLNYGKSSTFWKRPWKKCDVAIVREGNKTNYEVQFSAAEHGDMVKGRSVGASVCVNDGDKGQEGQKGRGGWYHSHHSLR